MVATTVSLHGKSGERVVSRDANVNAEPAALRLKGWRREEKVAMKVGSVEVDSLATHSSGMLCGASLLVEIE